MREATNKFRKIIYLFLILLFIQGTMLPVEAAADFLTEDEKEYISESKVIKAASLKGVAPLTFANSKGEAEGIAKRVVDEIANMTGLKFEFTLYDSVEEVLESDADILYCISSNYAPDDVPLSKPFLESITILYMNSSLDPEDLEHKTFAAIEGVDLPDGIDEDNVIFFKTRKEAIDAVEKGIADYGYGNAYSLSFYLMSNDYNNIVTVPQEMETRGYSIGMLHGDEILLDIINKSIEAIDETLMQTIILEVSTQVSQSITFDRMIATYGKLIIALTLIIIGILTYNVISHIRANNKLNIQIKRYEVLSQISNEYFYEYNIKLKRLLLSEKCSEIFGEGGELEEVKKRLMNYLSKLDSEEYSSTIELPLINGNEGVFKVISTSILNATGRADFIIGKLMDISEEIAEKEVLLNKSQIDGLTGLYNAATAKELIVERLKNKNSDSKDAFILIDCDDFKTINDTRGHLMGDEVLEHLAKVLKQTFRSTDIIGRIGGDEFCVYMTDVSSLEVVKSKCKQINHQFSKREGDTQYTVSIGIALVENSETYEEVFSKADIALYKAKDGGKAQFA